MNRRVCWSVGLLVAALPSAVGAADATGSPGTVKDASQLVRQLSDESFEVRDAGRRRLTAMGKAAEAALRQGARDDDAEVRRQCQLLLERATRSELTVALDAFLADRREEHVLGLPAWDRFKKMAGADPSAKALFVEMCCSEAHLLEALEKNPAEASKAFVAHVQQLQQSLFVRGGPRGTVSVGQVIGLLFIATDGRVQLDAQAYFPIYNLLQQPGRAKRSRTTW